MPDQDLSLLIVALLSLGLAIIVFVTDPRSRTSRALALAMSAIGLDVLIAGVARDAGLLPPLWIETINAVLESVAILAGIEWGRRIGESSVAGVWRKVVNVLFRISQSMIVIYGFMRLGYSILAPELAVADQSGFVRTSGLEFALFTPFLGVSMLFSGIAIVILFFVQSDRAESVRLRALLAAAPFLLLALMLNEHWLALSLTIGLLLFLYGSVRYLIIQSERGQFMSQFISPEVTRMMRAEGPDALLHRERRRISVVVCDIRGFTAYARTRDSSQVVDLLEAFYKAVGQVTDAHQSTVKDHAGDGILILVGAPETLTNTALVAIALAQDIMRQARPLLLAQSEELGLGVGVATGNTTIGTIQGAGRLEYVAVGNAVNLAARLCQRAEDGEVLLDEGTRRALAVEHDFSVQDRAPEPLKGFAEPVPVYSLT